MFFSFNCAGKARQLENKSTLMVKCRKIGRKKSADVNVLPMHGYMHNTKYIVFWLKYFGLLISCLLKFCYIHWR